MMDKTRCHVISGCSGGGKSTLLNVLADRGWTVVAEAGRQIVQSELASKGNALPWLDKVKFVEFSANLGLKQIEFALRKSNNLPIITDRCIVDVISYLNYCDIDTTVFLKSLLIENVYAPVVLITPPWRELFSQNEERPKDFDEAVREYEHLCKSYIKLGYELLEIPIGPIEQRADFVEAYFA